MLCDIAVDVGVVYSVSKWWHIYWSVLHRAVACASCVSANNTVLHPISHLGTLVVFLCSILFFVFKTLYAGGFVKLIQRYKN